MASEKREIEIALKSKSAESSAKSLNVAVREIGSSSDKANTSMFKMNKTAEGVKNGLSGVGRGAGQAGIQIQQFIGQVQGGQSAMLLSLIHI